MSKHIALKRKIIADEQIIEMYWQREEAAIQETDNKYGKFLYKIAFNILYDRYDSEECQNDTYLGIWNAIPPTRPAVFQAFITRIMRHIAINCYKKKICKKRVPSEMTVSMEELSSSLHSGKTVETDYDAEEVGKIISEYVRGLTDREQYIFVGRFYIAETVENIAKELGLTDSSVYKEIKKIKKGLKAHLERNEVYI